MAVYTLTNLIPEAASKFQSGWNRSSYDTAHIFHGSTSLKLTGTTSSSEILATLTASNIPQIQNHYYYARIYEYHTDSNLNNRSWQVYWPIIEPAFNSTIFGAENRWNLLGAKNIRSSWTSGDYQLRVDFDNNTVAADVWYDGLMLIDLTACFGSGSEPSVNWCNKNIPYFTGTITVNIPETKLRVKYNNNYILYGVNTTNLPTNSLNCNGKVMSDNIQIEVYK